METHTFAQAIAPMIVPVVTALSTIVSVLIPVLRSNWSVKKRMDAVELTLLQLILHDEHLPDRDRLNAGKRYLELGGNGATQIYYEELAAKYRERIDRKMLEVNAT